MGFFYLYGRTGVKHVNKSLSHTTKQRCELCFKGDMWFVCIGHLKEIRFKLVHQKSKRDRGLWNGPKNTGSLTYASTLVWSFLSIRENPLRCSTVEWEGSFLGDRTELHHDKSPPGRKLNVAAARWATGGPRHQTANGLRSSALRDFPPRRRKRSLSSSVCSLTPWNEHPLNEMKADTDHIPLFGNHTQLRTGSWVIGRRLKGGLTLKDALLLSICSLWHATCPCLVSRVHLLNMHSLFS